MIKFDHTNSQIQRYLTPDDDCYFIGDYTLEQGFDYNENNSFNSFILNLKKKPSSINGRPQLQRYKENAINWASDCIANSIALNNIVNDATFIPAPTSKAANHIDYDDRMLRVCKGIQRHNGNTSVMDILSSKDTRGALHEGKEARDPDTLEQNIILTQGATEPNNLIILVDDVITSGATFKACQNILLNQYPKKTVIGLFLARTVPAPIEWP